ncbi:GNAT family N-acetyltransferase [Peribacillus glennii]|uniref:N-acetyltransferase family protein n=1 Tax=Peribacillus glennii TaxID=2303991 RepID=A0A372L629_9BACI|nr:GNAT family N-acetyltransferase [Peribacillus glennii]RFU60439.1 N-acetyltransferase family protein [Peribacillus glennii]
MIHIRDAVIDDLPAMLAIYNYAIRNLTATFDLEEQTLEQRKAWFEKYGANYPLIVAEIDGEVAGYSCISPYNAKAAYAGTVELSVYLSEKHQGRGTGTALVIEILRKARELGYHTVLSLITVGNGSSIKLHEKFGFQFAGCVKEVGFKFGEWQDVSYYQLML